MKNSLEKYKSKRNFKRTNEPSVISQTKKDKNIFVIQKHNASKLHYDFRIEVNGVLKSWAVPKGLSTNPSVKRLAIQTEDHPFEYADFEGIIPKDEYGGGSVIVWDRGTYENITAKDDAGNQKSIAKSLIDGHLSVYLKGKKLKGGYALIKTGKSDDDRWLVIKMKDEESDARRNPTKTEPASVISGRKIEDLEKEE